MWSVIKEFIRSEIFKILVVGGLFLSILPFMKLPWVGIPEEYRWFFCVFGAIIVFIGIFLYAKYPLTTTRRISVKDIQKGLILTFGTHKVNLKVGKIEDIVGLDKNTAVVLPANVSFVDKCITDGQSAFGSFNSIHCLERIPELSKFIDDCLRAKGYQKNNEGAYLPGTTIPLSDFYNINVEVLLTASALKKEGFKTEPFVICECIRQIFEITADRRISILRMPVLGSGRGGLPISSALLLHLLSLNYYFSRFHHIKSVDLIITEDKAKEIPDYIKNLQYSILS